MKDWKDEIPQPTDKEYKRFLDNLKLKTMKIDLNKYEHFDDYSSNIGEIIDSNKYITIANHVIGLTMEDGTKFDVDVDIDIKYSIYRELDEYGITSYQHANKENVSVLFNDAYVVEGNEIELEPKEIIDIQYKIEEIIKNS